MQITESIEHPNFSNVNGVICFAQLCKAPPMGLAFLT